MFQKLEPPSIDSIKKVQKLIDGGGDAIDTLLGDTPILSTVTCPLKEAVWTSSREFILKKKQNRHDSRRVWLFTNDDYPNVHDIVEQARSVQVMRDAASTGVEISLWHMDRLDSNGETVPFDPKRFYIPAIGIPDDDLFMRVASGGTGGFDKTASRRPKTKRSLGTLHFYLSSEVPSGSSAASSASSFGGFAPFMGVKLYKLFSTAVKPKSTLIHKENLKVVIPKSGLMSSIDGKTISKSDVVNYIPVNGEEAYIPKESIKALRTGGVPTAHLRLLHCTHISNLPPVCNYTSPLFIVPDDGLATGSSSMFGAFVHSLTSKGLVAIASMTRTRSSPPRLVAMLPQADELDSYGGQVQPGGLNVILLPYKNDIRHNPVTLIHGDTSVPSVESIQAANNLIDTMQFDEGGTRRHTELQNPALRNFVSVLQAIALDQVDKEWNEEEHDTLRIAPEIRDNFEYISAIDDLFTTTGATNAYGDALSGPKAGSKRGGDDTIKPPKKQALVTASAEDIAGWKASDLSASTVDILKQICASLGLPKTGRKDDLIGRIQTKLSE